MGGNDPVLPAGTGPTSYLDSEESVCGCSEQMSGLHKEGSCLAWHLLSPDPETQFPEHHSNPTEAGKPLHFMSLKV